MTDAELLAEFVSGRDQDALTQLVERYERLVWSVCSRVLVKRTDREDAFQSTFLVLVKKAHRIRKPKSLSNWLYGTAWKVASRIRKRRANYSLDVLCAEGLHVADVSQPQLDAIARQHEIDLVDHQLQAMAERDRTPLVLYYFAGLTAKEIAHQLNLTPSAIEGRLRRARARMRAQLKREGLHHGPAAMLSALGNSVPPIELGASVVQQCVASGAGATAGVSFGTLSLGAKLMICKCMCVAGISTLLAVGGLFNANAPSDVSPDSIVAVAEVSSVDTESVSVAFSENAPFCCPLMSGITSFGEVCGAVHARMAMTHDSIAMKTRDLHDFVISMVVEN